ncbi:MAG TPA: hypothetical protein VGD81_05205 [Opitutaceae bacterium]
MSSSHPIRRIAARALFVAGLFTSNAVFAGPPLICNPFEAGESVGLPAGNPRDFHGASRSYDRTRVVGDALAALTPDRPVIVRMETLRRAAVYATNGMEGLDHNRGYSADDRRLALRLLEKLRARITAATATDDARALALFDVGFFSECLRQARLIDRTDGYDLLVKADRLRGGDPEIQFALALALAGNSPRPPEQAEHLRLARSGARDGSLLAANLASHFGPRD